MNQSSLAEQDDHRMENEGQHQHPQVQPQDIYIAQIQRSQREQRKLRRRTNTIPNYQALRKERAKHLREAKKILKMMNEMKRHLNLFMDSDDEDSGSDSDDNQIMDA